MKDRVRRRWLQGFTIVVGLVLLVIGLRFALVPRSAARFFGLDTPAAAPAHLHYVVALRDIWLALIIIGLAWWHQWCSAALWLGLGAMVCFADAVIVAHATGWPRAIAFHVVCGLFCAGGAIACCLEAKR